MMPNDSHHKPAPIMGFSILKRLKATKNISKPIKERFKDNFKMILLQEN